MVPLQFWLTGVEFNVTTCLIAKTSPFPCDVAHPFATAHQSCA